MILIEKLGSFFVPLFRSFPFLLILYPSLFLVHRRNLFDLLEKLMSQQLAHCNSFLRVNDQHFFKQINQVIGKKVLSFFRNCISQVSWPVQRWILNMIVQKFIILSCKWKTVFGMHLNELFDADQGSNGFEVVLFTVFKERLIVSEKSPNDNSERPYINGRGHERRFH